LFAASNISQGAWGCDLFQSDDRLDIVDELDDSADLGQVKQKILANPAKYSFPEIKKSEGTGGTEDEAENKNDDSHIYMTLYNPSHPVSQIRCTPIESRPPAPDRSSFNRTS